MVEVLLQLFISKVDTELFETVVVKVLKTKDVQNTWRGGEGEGEGESHNTHHVVKLRFQNYNYHTHTYRCLHRQYVLEVTRAGVTNS